MIEPLVREIELKLKLELELFFDELPADCTLLSITLPFHQRPFTNPLIPQEGVYWHSSATQRRTLSLGAAWSVTTTGRDRFSECEQQLQQLIPHWVELNPEESPLTPRLFLHYAFDENDPMEQEWQQLPNCELHLPRLQLNNRRGEQWISLSHTVDGEDSTTILQQWRDDLEMLQQLINQPPPENIDTRLTVQQRKQAPIEEALHATRTEGCEKIVVGEAQMYSLNHPLDLRTPLQRLEQRNPQGVQLCLSRSGRQFFAAPPEKLLHKSGASLQTEALAGTVPRGSNQDEEQAFEAQLNSDQKLQQEHHLVVDFIRQQLAAHSTTLEYPKLPVVHKLEHIQHLQTPIDAKVKAESSLFSLIAALHQSPAICGTPRGHALQWLRTHHNSRRGYYCGGAGWIDSNGDGEIHVLLRCGLTDGDGVTLYAGAGIIDSSARETEQHEIEIKINSMAEVLNSRYG